MIIPRNYQIGQPSHLMSYYSTGLIAIDERTLNDVADDIESIENKNVRWFDYRVPDDLV